MPLPNGVEVSVDNLKKISEALKALGSNKVLVGIPQENDPRSGSPIGNASLGYIMELGSPARNIPSRPFLVPGVKKSKDRWVKKLEQAAHDALAGEPLLMKRHLGEAGQIAVNAVKQTIQAGIPPVLSQATVTARRLRRPDLHYRVRIAMVEEEMRIRALPRGQRAAARLAAGFGQTRQLYLRQAQTPADVTALIDTGDLINSIVWVWG